MHHATHRHFRADKCENIFLKKRDLYQRRTQWMLIAIIDTVIISYLYSLLLPFLNDHQHLGRTLYIDVHSKYIAFRSYVFISSLDFSLVQLIKIRVRRFFSAQRHAASSAGLPGSVRYLTSASRDFRYSKIQALVTYMSMHRLKPPTYRPALTH